jgi:hypothetical protein
MTSTIKVNNIQNQCGANIINENSNTITIGASGDTINLASGASQTGFGRTGTVDWQTTKKTTSFTATNGEGYFVDTGGGAITATLPASPSAGNIVYIKDYDGNFGTAACTVGRNSSNIRGEASDFVLEKDNAGAVFIYVDATEGWQVFVDGSDTDAQAAFITATGGTMTTSPCGNDRIHTFTGPGTFTVTQIACSPTNNIVSYMVVAGGGGAGAGTGPDAGGGGGAGGFREYKSPVTPYTASPLDGNPGGTEITVSAQAYPITVGGGGTGQTFPRVSGSTSTNGVNSTFSSVTSAGGGFGGDGSGSNPTPFGPGRAASSGGSGGGGAGGSGSSCQGIRGVGNTPPVNPAQGNRGGHGYTGAPPDRPAGGGGGATGTGVCASGPASGPGGAGATTSITGTPTAYAGGGGGGFGCTSGGALGTGGTGGGGNGAAANSPTPGVAGTPNTGGGGGGGNGPANGGAGGSGIVVIRYKFQ